MYIFNTTFMIDDAIVDDWKQWMNRNYVPTMKDLVKSIRVELYEVMAVVEEGNTNFSCQMQVTNPADLDTINKYNAILVNNVKEKLGEKCLTFSSILNEVKDAGRTKKLAVCKNLTFNTRSNPSRRAARKWRENEGSNRQLAKRSWQKWLSVSSPRSMDDQNVFRI